MATSAAIKDMAAGERQVRIDLAAAYRLSRYVFRGASTSSIT
jgi:hypothetical protein